MLNPDREPPSAEYQMAELPKFPPLPFTRTDADRLIAQIERLYAELERHRANEANLAHYMNREAV